MLGQSDTSGGNNRNFIAHFVFYQPLMDGSDNILEMPATGSCRTIQFLTAIIGNDMDDFRAIPRQFGSGVFHIFHRRDANNQ